MLEISKGLLAALLAILNVLVLALPFFTAVALKILVPLAAGKHFFTWLVTAIARQYNRHNALIFNALSRISWRINGTRNLSKQHSYLVIANHRSWADIPVLQHCLEPHIPLLKFFLKKELIWVPVLGAAWWALDFPFMKRFSREYLEKHPEKRGQDLAETRKMCERFKQRPVSVMNFLEGTRFTPEKHRAQSSPYAHLLKPKAGGAALVINSMGGHIDTVLDINVWYHTSGDISLWKLFTGQVHAITVDINEHPIPSHFFDGDYENDPNFRQEFKDWIEEFWKQKDTWIAQKKKAQTQTIHGNKNTLPRT